MASYESPTIIQPTIPLKDMTPLEQLLLAEIFMAEDDADGVYFFAETTTNDMPEVELEVLRRALAASELFDSTRNDFVRGQIDGQTPDSATTSLDMSIISCEHIFQDIVRRSPTLTHVTAVSAFTCSKLRVDGFGGLAVLITAKEVRAKSLDDVLNDFIDEATRLGELPEGTS